ncbi:hypothetical protein L6249_02510, partial [Candidatus Parcubacteria bacterium]|nr:hypothetical protein [Candidatus Parcubacteria bacterium]
NPPNPPYEGGQSPPNPPYEGGQADNLTGVYEEYIMTHTEEVAGLNQTESDVSDISDESGELSDATTTAEEDIFTATTTEEAVLPEPEAEPGVEIIELPE